MDCSRQEPHTKAILKKKKKKKDEFESLEVGFYHSSKSWGKKSQETVSRLDNRERATGNRGNLSLPPITQ